MDMNLRAVPGSDLSGDPGHEGGSQPMTSLKGGCAAVNVQQPLSGPNTGAPAQDLANATDAQSPTSGHMGGSMQTYTGGGGGIGSSDNRSAAS